MSERKHGRRYSFKEKKDILDYLEEHTYKDTSKKFKISETTLSRWKKEIKSGSKFNRTKLIISLPKFWLEYLNEQIESDVWEDYSDAILSVIRYYFKSQTSVKKDDLEYLENMKEIIPKLLQLNPDIDSMLLVSSNEVLYKTERWGTTEGVQNLIESWKKFDGKIDKVRIEFQNETYSILEVSPKHLIGMRNFRVPLNNPRSQGYLLGMKRKLDKDDVFIFAIASEGSALALAINTLKRATMGSLPPISEDLKEDSPEFLKKLNEMITPEKDSLLKEEIRKEWGRVFQLKTKPLLMQLATQVNMSLKPEEKVVLDAIEKHLGRKLERITADPEQEANKYEIIFYNPGKLPWAYPDMNFPAPKFPCHYIALGGNIILMVLSNLGLSEVPSQLSNLTNLTYLNLNSNSITELSKTFLNLKSIENLFLDKNQFTTVPESIIELANLQKLSMQNNKISQIPDALTLRFEKYKAVFPNWTGESRLDFSGNKITHDSLSKEQQELVRQLILLI